MGTPFARRLSHHGPDKPFRRPSLPRARAYCRQLALTHYENFSVASLLLPKDVRPDFYAVYAYCRWADDLGDESRGGAEALRLLRWWRDEVRLMYAGEPRHPITVALAETVERHRIPVEPFLDLLFAFEQDQLVKRYRTFDQLLEYCRYSANPVGRLVLYLYDEFDAEKAAYADAICTGLQLANFWQDMARDFALGRVYLPEEDCWRFGYLESDLRSRRCTPAFQDLMRFEVHRARQFFEAGFPLVQLVPPRLAPQLELFVRGGLAVLTKIERQGYNVWRRRPKLAKWEKAWLIARTARGHWPLVRDGVRDWWRG